ncbi:MAG: PspC domain-containing protein [Calditrichaeota bacterium]|nr:MAG: PspC domain-containing protein [Calditrichota bacterium]
MRKSIFRSRANRKISGVCGGLADYLKIDANIIRLAFILLTIASAGLGILAYILLIIIFPEEPLALQKEEK